MSNVQKMYTKLMQTAAANTSYGLSQALAPIVHHALVHGQVRIRELNQIRSLQDPKLKSLKVAIGKTMPISWNKEKNTYVFSKQKRLSLQKNIDITSLVSVQDTILSIIDPARKADVEQKPKQVKAWDGKQLQRQIERLDEMDADQLQAQVNQLESLLESAKNRLRSRAGEFLRVVGSHDEH